MEQATATTTTELKAVAPETHAFQQAHTIASAVTARLAQLPFAVEIEEDFPSGWRVHLKFRQTRAEGLMELAALVDVPVTRATTEFGIHLEAYARVEDVEVRGSALVSTSLADELLQQTPQPDPVPAADTDPAPSVPIPLGASVLAHTVAISPVFAPGGAQ